MAGNGPPPDPAAPQAPASTTPDRERLDEEYRMLLFGVRRSARYHLRRRRFYEHLHDLVLQVAMASLSVTAVGLVFGWLEELPTPVAVAFPASVLAMALSTLVVGPLRKASLHWELERRFVALGSRMVRTGSSPSDAALAEATQERLAIESDEPPVLRVLNTLCHNELLREMGYPRSDFVRVTSLQRFLANLADFRFTAPSR